MAPLRAAKDRWTAIHAAIQLARNLPPGEREAWFRGASFPHGDPLVSQMFMLELEELLFEADPYRLVAAEMMVEEGKPLRRRERSKGQLERLAKMDAEKLIAVGQSASNAEHGREMMLAGMKELVEHQPATVLELALNFPPPGWHPSPEMIALLAKAGGGDADKLLQLAEGRGDQWRSMLRAAAGEAMLAKDLDAGIHWLSDAPDSKALFAALFSDFFLENPESRNNARRLAGNLALLPDDFAKTMRNARDGMPWPSALDAKGNEDIWLTADLDRLGMQDWQQAEFREGVVLSMARQDPLSVMKYLNNPAVFSPEKRKPALVRMLKSQLYEGGEMPPDLLAMLGAEEIKMLQDEEAKIRAEETVFKPRLGVTEEFAKILADPASDDLGIESTNWTPDQLEEGLAYVRNAKPEVLRQLTERAMRTNWISAPLEAEIYRLALVNKLEIPELDEKVVEIAIGMTAAQPAKAAAWAEKLPPGAGRLYSIQNIAAGWNASDPAGAAAWISRLKDPSEVDAAKTAIRTYLKQVE